MCVCVCVRERERERERERDLCSVVLTVQSDVVVGDDGGFAALPLDAHPQQSV